MQKIYTLPPPPQAPCTPFFQIPFFMKTYFQQKNAYEEQNFVSQTFDLLLMLNPLSAESRFVLHILSLRKGVREGEENERGRKKIHFHSAL